MSGFGVYVHIPFCRARCTYCDFNTVTGTPPARQHAYYDALLREWAARDLPDGPVVSVFFGGGTPSLADPPVIAAILDAVRTRVPLAPDAEVTMEMNPGTVNPDRLAGYRAAGVNRVSLGVQAAQDHHLRRLNRTHDFNEAVRAVEWVRAAGFDNLNLDAIYGLPGQTLAEWQETVQALLALAPDHLSLYQLQVETGTPLARDVGRGRLHLPDPDRVVDMAEWAEATVPAHGLARYEVSNFARPGRESVHNRLYWRLLPYVGIGAGAHSFRAPERRWNIRGIGRYIDTVHRGEDPAEGREVLPARVLAGEFVWLGLRETRGIRLSEFAARFGRPLTAAFPGQVERFCRDGLLTLEGDRLVATPRGLSLLNRIAAEFLEAVEVGPPTPVPVADHAPGGWR
jgi:oxygen-independent coproporphyrinogen-3 oxidase